MSYTNQQSLAYCDRRVKDSEVQLHFYKIMENKRNAQKELSSANLGPPMNLGR